MNDKLIKLNENDLRKYIVAHSEEVSLLNKGKEILEYCNEPENEVSVIEAFRDYKSLDGKIGFENLITDISIVRNSNEFKKAKISRDMKNRKAIPTEKEKEHLKRLLEDFGIYNIKIPEFLTKADMDIWRKRTISNYLSLF